MNARIVTESPPPFQPNSQQVFQNLSHGHELTNTSIGERRDTFGHARQEKREKFFFSFPLRSTPRWRILARQPATNRLAASNKQQTRYAVSPPRISVIISSVDIRPARSVPLNTLATNSRLSSCIAKICSSIVSRATNRITVTACC